MAAKMSLSVLFSKEERAIRKAHRRIKKRGWTQGLGPIWVPGADCVAYALSQASYRVGADVDTVMTLFADRAGIPFPYANANPTQRLTNWNDKDYRQESDVHAAFRRAKRWLRSE